MNQANEDEMFLTAVAKLDREKKEQLHRAITRLMNGSRKVRRLLDLFGVGQISAADFIKLAGS